MSQSKLCYLPKLQIKARFEVRSTVYSPEIVSQSQMSKAVFHWCKTGEWSYVECSYDETRPTAELSNVKNGILRPQWVHPGSICLEGGWSRWLKSALREARCNQASKMRMTISTLVDWGCLAASLSAGHHQERLLGQPLWPYCGFKFPFEGGFVSSYFLTKQLNFKGPGLSGSQKVQFYCWLISKTNSKDELM